LARVLSMQLTRAKARWMQPARLIQALTGLVAAQHQQHDRRVFHVGHGPNLPVVGPSTAAVQLPTPDILITQSILQSSKAATC